MDFNSTCKLFFVVRRQSRQRGSCASTFQEDCLRKAETFGRSQESKVKNCSEKRIYIQLSHRTIMIRND